MVGFNQPDGAREKKKKTHVRKGLQMAGEIWETYMAQAENAKFTTDLHPDNNGDLRYYIIARAESSKIFGAV